MEALKVKDVTPDSSAGTQKEEVVKPDSETTPELEPQETPEAETSTPEVKEELPKDRPIENVAWETKRKLDEIYPLINELRDVIPNLKNIKPHEEPVKPTKEQLIYWKSLTQGPNELARIDIELEKTRDREMRDLIESTQKRASEQTMGEVKRQNSVAWVGQILPQCFTTDPMGNKQWDTNNSLTQRIFQYMQNPAIRNDPEGVMAAAKMAAFDMGVSMNLQNKVNRTIGQLRKEQKKQLASAGGTREAENPQNALQTRYEKLKKIYNETGSREAFAEIVKLKKLNPFV